MTWGNALKGLGAYGAYRQMKNADWPGEVQEYLLDRMGLERKSTSGTVFAGIGFFALGVLVGSALGLMFAPMAGTEMRSTIKEQGMKGVMDKTRTAAATTPTA